MNSELHNPYTPLPRKTVVEETQSKRRVGDSIPIFVFLTLVSLSNEFSVYLGTVSVPMWSLPHNFPTSLKLWSVACAISAVVSFLCHLVWQKNSVSLLVCILAIAPAFAIFVLQQILPSLRPFSTGFGFVFVLQGVFVFYGNDDRRILIAFLTSLFGIIGTVLALVHFTLYSLIT